MLDQTLRRERVMSFEDLTFSWQIGIGYSGANHKDTVKVSDHFTEDEWDEKL